MTAQAKTVTRPIGGQSTSTEGGTAPSAVSEHPQFNVTNRKGLPDGVSSNTKQLVGLCCDISGSMFGSKIDNLNKARFGLTSILGDPINKDGFVVIGVDFNEDASLIIDAEPASRCQMPTSIADGGTDFDAPLKMMVERIKDFASRPNPDGWRYLRPHVLFLSDGQANVTQSNIDALHELADITAIAYGDDADEATLSRIASNGEVHIVESDGSALRDFLAEVGQTLSEGRIAEE